MFVLLINMYIVTNTYRLEYFPLSIGPSRCIENRPVHPPFHSLISGGLA